MDIGSGFFACETDASVQIQYGVAIGITAAPEDFYAKAGETVYSDDGTAMDTEDDTLLDLPVYRGDDGRLILGWRHCEDAYPSSTPQ